MGVPWKYSLAKEELEEGLTNGTIPLDDRLMGPQEVYNIPDRPSFRKYPYENFKNNLKNLREAITLKKETAVSDSAALAQDLLRYPRPTHNCRGKPRWEKSPAQKFLKIDVGRAAKEGKRLKVKELYGTRPEYQAFARADIRKHIYQEEQCIKFDAYLEFKKRKDVEKILAKRAKYDDTAAEVVVVAGLQQQQQDAEPLSNKKKKAATNVCGRCGKEGHSRVTSKKCIFHNEYLEAKKKKQEDGRS